MIEKEQIALFERVRKRFRRWSKRKCSGYVHGIMDESNRAKPQPCVASCLPDEYYVAYVYGFVDARGPDATCEEWYTIDPRYRTVGLATFKLDYRWWDE